MHGVAWRAGSSLCVQVSGSGGESGKDPCERARVNSNFTRALSAFASERINYSSFNCRAPYVEANATTHMEDKDKGRKCSEKVYYTSRNTAMKHIYILTVDKYE